MKILFINKDDNRGGAAQMAWNLAAELRVLGHEVRFIVRRKFSNDSNVYELKENPVLSTLRKITKRDFTVVLSNFRDQVLSNDIDMGIEMQILNHPWINWADVIHFHNLHGNYFKLSNIIEISKKKPVVWTLHDLWAVTGHCAYPFECKRFQNECGQCPRLHDYQKLLWDNSKHLINSKKEIYRKSKLNIVVPSGWMAGMVSTSILKEKNSKVISNGINTKIFTSYKKKNAKNELNLPVGKKIILFFTYGFNNINKGWRHIEKILHHYKNKKDILFVGIGNLNGAWKNVTCVDPIYDQKQMVKYYNASDMLLFPSLSESFGMVPLEASGCGTPVVAFPVGIIPDLITHKRNGYISEYNNTKSLIKGIEYFLCKNNEDLSKIALKNVKIVKDNFSLKKMGKSYSKFYEKICK